MYYIKDLFRSNCYIIRPILRQNHGVLDSLAHFWTIIIISFKWLISTFIVGHIFILHCYYLVAGLPNISKIKASWSISNGPRLNHISNPLMNGLLWNGDLSAWYQWLSKVRERNGSRAKFYGEIKISLHFLQHLQNVNTVNKSFSQHIIMGENGGGGAI